MTDKPALDRNPVPYTARVILQKSGSEWRKLLRALLTDGWHTARLTKSEITIEKDFVWDGTQEHTDHAKR